MESHSKQSPRPPDFQWEV
ncbi:hypothetical protein CAEBREN_08965 [Caenorhabditis brenneri]|uniref:Uncharacterized protein n=1 Tax=Caenorhabditis brenneri TaxID=135651 RepID=G0N1E3_CAEBE|nr:hypothetical protein CAEBREN_08965 [Caenorhabditis brenneri]